MSTAGTGRNRAAYHFGLCMKSMRGLCDLLGLVEPNRVRSEIKVSRQVRSVGCFAPVRPAEDILVSVVGGQAESGDVMMRAGDKETIRSEAKRLDPHLLLTTPSNLSSRTASY